MDKIMDSNPRPQKRQRIDQEQSQPTPPLSSPLTTPPSSQQPPFTPTPTSHPQLAPLPTTHLLLALPLLLQHPPTHKHHPHSLHLSLLALRRVLAQPGGLAPDVECRAWSGLAEVGMRVIGGGFRDGWAEGVEGEVGKAIGKGVRTIYAIIHLTIITNNYTASLIKITSLSSPISSPPNPPIRSPSVVATQFQVCPCYSAEAS